MKPTKPGEWWWCNLDGARVAALIGTPRSSDGPLLAYLVGTEGHVGIDLPGLVWLGPVAPFAPSPDPAAPDATDEVRLAAGWRQQACLLASYDEAAPPAGHAPAPGPAGLWRLHASGVWMRWVVAS